MSKTIAVFSIKGGVGTTFIATNLAVALGREEKQRVLLIDLNLQATGDMARMIDLSPQKSLLDFIEAIKTQQPQNFKKSLFLTRSLSLDIDLLPAVLRPQQFLPFKFERMEDVFDAFEQDYDYIIIDAGREFNETLLAVLNHANLILMVVSPDILSIYQTKWAVETLQFLHLPLAMIKIILNRAASASSISWNEVRVSLPIDIIAKIPSEGKAVIQAVNRGVPIVIDGPRTKITQAIKKLSHTLTTEENLFIEHRTIDQMQLKDAKIGRPGSFWEKQGFTEAFGYVVGDYPEKMDEVTLLKRRIHNRLIEELNLKRLDLRIFSDPKKAKELRDKAEIMITNFLTEETNSFIASQDMRNKLVKEIQDEALGLGPLEDLLVNPTITDIMVNNKDEVYIERLGKIELTDKKFTSNEQVRTIIERIIAPIGRRIDESVPMVDARLPDGSRVNAIISPLSLTGPTLTIRKFRKERFTIDELVGFNTLSQAMSEFIKLCVLCRKNILVSGGTGSGKTTVLNVLSAFIPDGERIVTIEDAAELKLHQRHWIRLESRPPNIEGKGAVSIRDLFRNSLRMRPDRIIIGECRGIETLDMLQAMNTGHDGSMSTIHANSTHDVLTRLDSMILMAGIELPIRAIREMVASAIDLIIHTARLSDGSRKIVQITEVSGMKDDIHIDLRDIFSFQQSSIDKQGKILGDFKPTGYIPSFLDEIRVKGILISENLFKP